MRILLTLAYDGTHYAGWQRQINALSVQQVLEEALTTFIKRDVRCTAASRTDAGVHALGQRVAFAAEGLRIPVDKLPRVLNGLLPPAVNVTAAAAVADNFNPRFAARYKTYVYRIYNAPVPNPLLRRYSAFVSRPLDIPAMQKAAQHIVGRHDFAAFCAVGGSAKTTVREIYACTVTQGQTLDITVTGGGFLYNMVRIIAGTLVYTGLGKIDAGAIPDILAGKNRNRAGKTMPAHGLTLLEVSYDGFSTPRPPR